MLPIVSFPKQYLNILSVPCLLFLVSIFFLSGTVFSQEVEHGIKKIQLGMDYQSIETMLQEDGVLDLELEPMTWDQIMYFRHASGQMRDLTQHIRMHQHELIGHCSTRLAPLFHHENSFIKRQGCKAPVVKSFDFIRLRNYGYNMAGLTMGEWDELYLFFYNQALFALVWCPSEESFAYWRREYYNAYASFRQYNPEFDVIYDWASESTRVVAGESGWLFYYDLTSLEAVKNHIEAGFRADLDKMLALLDRRMISGWNPTYYGRNYLFDFERESQPIQPDPRSIH